MRLAITRLVIPGWIRSGRVGNSAAGCGSCSRLLPFRALRNGASLRFTLSLSSLRFHELRNPKCRVFIKRRPVQVFGVAVEEGLQRCFVDTTIPFPVEKAGLNPLLNFHAPHVKSFGQFTHGVPILQSSRDSTPANHVPDRLLRSSNLFGDFLHTHVVQGFE